MALFITFILYFCIIFCIGYFAYASTKSHEDYVLGGRKLNSIITALGVGASDMSGWLMIGLPGALYLYGIDHIWMPVGLLIGAYLNWKFIAFRLRIFTIEADNSLTIPSYLEHRFDDRSGVLRSVTSLVIIIFFAIYSSAGFVSSGLLFSSTFGISYHSALLIGVTLLVVYTSIGGFLAVNWVDVFQGGLMLLALIFMPLYIFNNITDANLFSISYLQSHYPLQFDADYFDFLPKDPSNYTKIALLTIISTLSWGLGYFGQPHILVRFMAANSKQAIIKARRICMSWMFLALLGAIAVGLIGKLYYVDNPLSDPEQVFFELVHDNINIWLAGWLIAAVLSCVMSTVAAQLILSASALCEDIYHARINPNADDKMLLWVGRLTVIVVALLALVLAWNKNSTVLELVGHSWAGLGSAFGPVILLSLFWRRMTRKGAIAGIVVGASTVLLYISLRYILNSLWHLDIEILKLYEIVPGFVCSFISIFIVSIRDSYPSVKAVELYNRSHQICTQSVT